MTQSSTTQTQILVDLIRSSHIREFTQQEKDALDNLGCRDENGYLQGSARIDLRGGQRKLIIGNPHVLCDGLIRAFTPTMPEASCVIPVNEIEGVYFSD